MTRCKNDLLNFLQKPSKKLNVVTTPDFFLDRLVNLNCTIQEFTSTATSVIQHKGGSIDQIQQTDLRGGNAINVTSALAALGAKVTPIVCTSKLGREQIRFHLKELSVDTSHIKTYPEASITTALEFKTENGKANVMLRNLGSLTDFGPSDLTDKDFEIIEKANYVCVFNWAGTRKFGTELAETVFRHAKTKGKGKTYLDTADPMPNKEEIPELMEKVLKSPLVDVLSVNENEAVTYATLLDSEIGKKRKHMRLDDLAMEAARILAKRLKARIDLHTTAYSAALTKKHEVVVPAFKINALRATGAGDAWDAGNIIGNANALTDECRLALANAVSACYLSDTEGTHPTRQKLAAFIKKATWQG